jgi:L,D-transpeptidase catalytic domain
MYRTVFPGFVALALLSACTPAGYGLERVFPGARGSGTHAASPEPAPPPWDAAPGAEGDSAVWKLALDGSGRRILVSRERKLLWLMEGDSIVKAAPVAVGRDTIFRYGEKSWDFSTPTGRRTVLDKEESPDWVPPDWHYFEKAVEDDLEPVHLKEGDRIVLSDGTRIEVRGKEVGRVNQFGNWWAFTPGSEIVFDDKIFIPPIGSAQRRIPKVLGTHRLILGDGYLIHGTPEEDSIGEEASHGCIRMFNRDVAELFDLVPKGTPVFVF